jgi:adenine-specific DNA-methyltransferase
LVELGDLASVKRGIATGANDFFILSENEVRQRNISRKYLRPIITNARFIPHIDFTDVDFESLKKQGVKVWLLDVADTIEELKGDPVADYLALGQRRELHERYLTKTRKKWYFQQKRPPPTIIFPLMMRKSPP